MYFSHNNKKLEIDLAMKFFDKEAIRSATSQKDLLELQE